MIRVSALGRLGFEPSGNTSKLSLFDDSASSDGAVAAEPAAETTPFTPSSKILDSLSVGGSEFRAATSGQSSSSSKSGNSDESTWDFWFGKGKETGQVIKEVVIGGYPPASYTPPPSTGPSGGTIALVAVLALGAIGGAYMLLSE